MPQESFQLLADVHHQTLTVSEVLDFDLGDRCQRLAEEVDASVLGFSTTVGLTQLLEAHDIASRIQQELESNCFTVGDLHLLAVEGDDVVGQGWPILLATNNGDHRRRLTDTSQEAIELGSSVLNALSIAGVKGVLKRLINERGCGRVTHRDSPKLCGAVLMFPALGCDLMKSFKRSCVLYQKNSKKSIVLICCHLERIREIWLS